jgi:hypothetical protein
VDSTVAYFWTPAKSGGFHLRPPPVIPSEGHAGGQMIAQKTAENVAMIKRRSTTRRRPAPPSSTS